MQIYVKKDLKFYILILVLLLTWVTIITIFLFLGWFNLSKCFCLYLLSMRLKILFIKNKQLSFTYSRWLDKTNFQKFPRSLFLQDCWGLLKRRWLSRIVSVTRYGSTLDLQSFLITFSFSFKQLDFLTKIILKRL